MAQPDLERLFASCGAIITSRILCDNMSGASRDSETGGKILYTTIKCVWCLFVHKDFSKFSQVKQQLSLAFPRDSIQTNTDLCANSAAYERVILSNIQFKIIIFIPGSSKDGAVPGISKGVGFIRFDQRVEAERAIAKLNGTIPEVHFYGTS